MAFRFVLVCAASTGVGAQAPPPPCKSITEKPGFIAEAMKLDKAGPAEAMQRCVEAQMQSPATKALTAPGGVCEGKDPHSVSQICSSPACHQAAKESTINMMAHCIPAGFPLLIEMEECVVEHMCDGTSITDSMAIAGMPQIMVMIARAKLDNNNGMPQTLAGESTCEVRAGFQCAGISAGCCKANQDMAKLAAGAAKKIKDAGSDAAKIEKIGAEGKAMGEKIESECRADMTAMKKCAPSKTVMVAEEPQQMLAGFCGFLAGAAVMGLATGMKRWQSPKQSQLLG